MRTSLTYRPTSCTPTRASSCSTPTRSWSRTGVKIGFIGVTTPETEEIVLSEAVAPFDFLDISESVDRYVPELQAQGVETIVVLAHSGGTQGGGTATGEIITETQQMSDEVDVVVSGHSHTTIDTVVDGKLVVQAYSYGTAFADIDLTIDRATGDVVEASADVVRTCTRRVKPDPELDRKSTRLNSSHA